MDLKVAAVGLFVGLLVGMTGMGGGALMTPILILFHWAKPVMAVGTDLVWGTLTKSVGAFVHYRQETVDFTIVKRLAYGSIPGALIGLGFLSYLHRQGADTVDKFVVRMLGIVLMCVAASLFIRCVWRSRTKDARPPANMQGAARLTTLVGAVVGFLVSVTSVGSGSLIVACLVPMYATLPLRRIVGSDIFHAVLLVGVSALGHFGLGSVNLPLLAGLLVGSIPGVWLGSRLSSVFPEQVLRPILASTLMFVGYKLL
jgi:uncharacterized protein